MKILIIGSFQKWAIEKIYAIHLSKMAKVELFDAHSMFQNFYTKSLWNKIVYRLGFSKVLKHINSDIINQVNSFKPDIVWVFKGMEVLPSTLNLLSKMGVKLANYNPDHPLTYFSRGSGNENVKHGINYYDLHFSYSKKIISELKRYNSSIKTEYLPFGYSNAEPFHENQGDERRICFIGNADRRREEVIYDLLRAKVPVDIYGSAWSNKLKNMEGVRVFGGIYGDEFGRVARRYRLQLNIFRPHNIGSHNMRTFEMPALSCILLSPKTEEHSSFFKENEEAFYYKNNEDLVNKVRMILKMDESTVSKVRKSAFNRSIQSGYSYEDRAKFVYNVFQKQLLAAE